MLDFLRNLVLASAHVYFVGLAGWLLLWAVARDANGFLFAVNSLGAYLFLPVPVYALVAWAGGRRDLALWAAMGAVMWAVFFGRLFLPRAGAAQAGEPTLRVMAYNLLGYNRNTDGVVAALRAAEADIVALQELNPANAAAIEAALGDVYPYRVFDQREGVTGSGILSRYPLDVRGHIPGPWLGTAQVVFIDVGGRTVTLIRLHAYSGPHRVAEREEAARLLTDYVARHPDDPILAMGDLNATPLNGAYRIATAQLRDAWAVAGWGLGHTFPGADSPGSSRPRLFGFLVPRWLVRIDYVLVSEHFEVLSARIGPWDGASDHRPVLAEVRLVK